MIKMSLRRDKKNARKLKATVILGKKGLTDGIIKEIKKQLRTRGMIKIKMLKSFLRNKDRKEVPGKVASKTKSKVINLVGNVFVLKKKKKDKKGKK